MTAWPPTIQCGHAKGLLRELLAEFLGTFILIVFGVGVVAQVVLSKKLAGDFLSINTPGAWR
jgi:glycerol uptake facilitator-like aquaporin